MKKKFVVLFLVAIITVSLVGCTVEDCKDYTNRTSGRLIQTTMSDLYYDANTKIVYIMFNDCAEYCGYGYMSAYYAPNGFPYMYNPQTNELEEIIKEG